MDDPVVDPADELRRYAEALERSLAPVAAPPNAEPLNAEPPSVLRPNPRRGPSRQLVAVAAVLTMLVLAGAFVVVRRSGTSVSVTGDPSGSPGSVPGTAPLASSTTPTGTTTPTPAAPLQPYQADAAPPGCSLVAGRADLGDLPPIPDPYASGYEYTDRNAHPAPGSIDTQSPPVFSALSRTGSWFRLGDRAVVRYDPATGRPDRAFRLVGSCQIWTAAASGTDVAVYACDRPLTDAATATCAVLIARIDDGMTVGAWAVPSSRAASGLAWSQDRLVIALGAPLAWVVRIDPTSGSGTLVDSLPFCVLGQMVGVVERTSLVVAGWCAPGQGTVLFDAATGLLLDRGSGFTRPEQVLSDGTEVWAPSEDRRDAKTWARTGPSHVAPDVLAAIIGQAPSQFVDAIEVADALWTLACLAPCRGDVNVELNRVDPASGDVTDRWVATDTLVSRETRPGSVKLAAADPDGIWYLVQGRLYRLNRHR